MIGRKKEIEELNALYQSQKAELVAVYGRRRVGKTYLVDQVLDRKSTRLNSSHTRPSRMPSSA